MLEKPVPCESLFDDLRLIPGEPGGALPLSKIRSDLHSAEMMLCPDPPYWHGLEEAMSTALEDDSIGTTPPSTGAIPSAPFSTPSSGSSVSTLPTSWR
jgi:hypothetical protein